MRRDAQELALSTTPAAGMSRAAWIAIAVSGLAAAGLAGALVMRSLDSSTPAAAPLASQEAAPAAVATAPQPQAAEPTPPAAAVAPTAAAPARAKPKPAVAAAPASPERVAEATPPPTAAVAHAEASPPPPAPAPAPVCTNCGVVESVSAVTQKGQGTGVGAVAGGVVGGVVGHQMGGGRGKTAMTVLGAVGGALAGNEVEKRTRSETVYNVHVRMDDGSTRVVQQSQSMAVGTHVVVEGSTLRLASPAAKGG